MEQLTDSDLEKLSHNFQVRFALFCAKQVIHLVNFKDKAVCENAILTTEKWLEGKATAEECRIAASAATSATWAADATDAAADAAADAARSAMNATWTADAAADAVDASKNKQQAIKEQWDYYLELLNFDKNFEEIVLT